MCRNDAHFLEKIFVDHQPVGGRHLQLPRGQGICSVSHHRVDADPGGKERTIEFMTPQQLTSVGNVEGVSGIYYNLIAKQIKISPPQPVGSAINITYYQKIIALTSTNDNNWLSEYNPDTYIFGLLVEISAFVKDKETATLWDLRFKESLDEIKEEDAEDRWSGTPLQARIG